jgi:hypothetical protein
VELNRGLLITNQLLQLQSFFYSTCGGAFAAGGNSGEDSCDGSGILMSEKPNRANEKNFFERTCMFASA